MNPADLRRKALSTYVRGELRRSGYSAPAPSDAFVRIHRGRGYVVVCDTSVLAVYRVLAGGVLRRLRRWPAEIET